MYNRRTGNVTDRHVRLCRPILILLLTALFIAPLAGCSCFGTADKKQGKKAAEGEMEPQITCPLCGLAVPDYPTVDHRPLAVKIDNDPKARPQSGLDKACVIYEEETEGGITRFMAIFLCRNAEVIGPVRSARPVDIDLAFPYNALLCHCGGGPATLDAIKQSGIPDLDEMAWTGAYYRTRDRRAPYNLYTSIALLRGSGDGAFPFHDEVTRPFVFLSLEEQAKMEKERASEVKKWTAQQSNPSPTYQPTMVVVNNIHIPYTAVCAVQYSYDPATGRFARLTAGKPHLDAQSQQQLMADTVIVQYVTEIPSVIVDVKGASSPELGVLGSGRAQIFIRGRLVEATWQKNSRGEHTRFTDAYGADIKLQPGSIWIELVPTSKQATFD